MRRNGIEEAEVLQAMQTRSQHILNKTRGSGKTIRYNENDGMWTRISHYTSTMQTMYMRFACQDGWYVSQCVERYICLHTTTDYMCVLSG